MRRLWCTIAAIIALALPAIADDPADAEAKRLDGAWQFVALTVDGEKAPEDFLRKSRWDIRGKTMTFPGGEITMKVDPSRSPKAIDMTNAAGPEKGKTAEGIYVLEGDRLTICLPGGKGDAPGKPRPSEFSGGVGMSLLVLKRIPEK